MEKTTTLIPRMRTIREAYGWLKNQDPETCLSYNAFRKIVLKGNIPALKIGNRYLLNVDAILPALQQALYVRVINEHPQD